MAGTSLPKNAAKTAASLEVPKMKNFLSAFGWAKAPASKPPTPFALALFKAWT
jgi:hypothetical protein